MCSPPPPVDGGWTHGCPMCPLMMSHDSPSLPGHAHCTSLNSINLPQHGRPAMTGLQVTALQTLLFRILLFWRSGSSSFSSCPLPIALAAPVPASLSETAPAGLLLGQHLAGSSAGKEPALPSPLLTAQSGSTRARARPLSQSAPPASARAHGSIWLAPV